MGKLPELGKWVQLQVDAALVGLKAGSELNGWAFTQVGGTVHWDTAGVTSKSLSDDQKRSLFAWEQFRKKVKQPALPADIQKIIDIEKPKRTEAQTKQLTRHYIRNVHPDSRAMLAEPLKAQATLKKQLTDLEKAYPATLVMEDRKEARQAYILERGQYTEKREKVSSAIPEWIAPPVKGAPANRLGLAQWLVQPKHPLTSRVTVNRFWQQFFGTGLVKTAEDFGVQGEQPSHPELLDWLAVQLQDDGWDVQKTLRRIVMSETYRQDASVHGPADIDPENRLLSRGPRFRLDAEVLRDQALFVSGLLVEKRGGPSVKPPQPDGLWFAVGYSGSNTVRFKPDTGPDKVHRRTLYTFLKRTAPAPQMSIIDAPSRESCTVRRERTNTPLQALLLLNDPQYVECARGLADRVLREGGKTVESRVAYLLRLCTSRVPVDSEVAELIAVITDLHAVYSKDRESAAKLVGATSPENAASAQVVERAAWTVGANLVLNLDEVLTKN